MSEFPFGTVIRTETDLPPYTAVVLMVIGLNLGVCLADLAWRYAGEVMEFAGDDWEVLDGP